MPIIQVYRLSKINHEIGKSFESVLKIPNPKPHPVQLLQP